MMDSEERSWSVSTKDTSARVFAPDAFAACISKSFMADTPNHYIGARRKNININIIIITFITSYRIYLVHPLPHSLRIPGIYINFRTTFPLVP